LEEKAIGEGLNKGEGEERGEKKGEGETEGRKGGNLEGEISFGKSDRGLKRTLHLHQWGT
jgi:hypothetical protein